VLLCSWWVSEDVTEEDHGWPEGAARDTVVDRMMESVANLCQGRRHANEVRTKHLSKRNAEQNQCIILTSQTQSIFTKKETMMMIMIIIIIINTNIIIIIKSA
jgi:hypothetical protein